LVVRETHSACGAERTCAARTPRVGTVTQLVDGVASSRSTELCCRRVERLASDVGTVNDSPDLRVVEQVVRQRVDEHGRERRGLASGL
jgi:hypothetical protein